MYNQQKKSFAIIYP